MVMVAMINCGRILNWIMKGHGNHIWNFSSVGGEKRVNLESGRDLVHLGLLDQKLWTALSCPVHGLEIDPGTLELIDTNKDGKIRVPEVIAAVNWINSHIHDPDLLLRDTGEFPLSAINTQTDDGKKLLASAKLILKNLGKEGSTTLTVAETSDTKRIFASAQFNGDGIITPDSLGDEALEILVSEIISTVGSSIDRTGNQGVAQEQLVLFLEQCEDYSSWQSKAESCPHILPFGERTETAFQCYIRLKPKVDDYFIRCKLAGFDPQSKDKLNVLTSQIENLSGKNLSLATDEISAYPLAKVDVNRPLPLLAGVNPVWEDDLNLFYTLVVSKVLPGKDSLSQTDWKMICTKFLPYIKWKEEARGTKVESLGLNRVREILASNHFAKLDAMMMHDLALADQAKNIFLVDQLVRYHRDLFKLLKNFVTFYDFYSPGSRAVFQAGTLYIDQRSCDLCIRVSDVNRHAAMAIHSGMFLIYCECVSKLTHEKIHIVAALTNGDTDNLAVGRNALFYDRNGNDWDATIVKIIDNPISISQAFWSPYKKVYRFVETQINKVAAEKEASFENNTFKKIAEIPAKPEIAAPATKQPVQPFDVGKFVGIFAAIGLALGAISSAIVSVISGFMGLVWWKMPLAFAGLLLVVSGPPMVMAFVRLRVRNLAPILDANGWAINARATVNIQFGNTLTKLAQLPKGARVNLNDPFTKKKKPIMLVMILVMIMSALTAFALWHFGVLKLVAGH